MGRVANYFSRAKQRVKFVTEDRRYYRFGGRNSALTYRASSFEMKYPVSGALDLLSNGHFNFVEGDCVIRVDALLRPVFSRYLLAHRRDE